MREIRKSLHVHGDKRTSRSFSSRKERTVLDGHWDDLDLDVRAIFDYFCKVMTVCVCVCVRERDRDRDRDRDACHSHTHTHTHTGHVGAGVE